LPALLLGRCGRRRPSRGCKYLTSEHAALLLLTG
jgi:hypothetical protein